MNKNDPQAYEHSGSSRSNNPTQEAEKFLGEDERSPVQYEPELRSAEAPRLAWQRSKPDAPSRQAGPLYIHEKIDPSVFLEQLEGSKSDMSRELALFPDLPEDAQFECYRHSGGWSNRLIHGDSAQIMASLLGKENMQGKVQMVYFDPPYGISFNSNMQVRTDSRESERNQGGVSPEPEMVRAFRDTYKNGIHDYLDGVRENAILARNLLAESGSFFLQIGARNVHRLAVLLDEVFGVENRVATITFRKTAASSASTLPEVADYLLWYAKDKKIAKYQHIYKPLDSRKAVLDAMGWNAMIEQSDGICRELSPDERENPESIDPSCRLFQRMPLMSQGHSATGRSEPFSWEGGEYRCRPDSHWAVSHEGLQRLADKNRLIVAIDSQNLCWKLYEREKSGTKINNVWDAKHSPSNMRYVVETAEVVIERCILMVTDPGDLVLDITCGSGTTPFVAEKWGRRWIATDVSRVPIAIARQRVLSSVHDWFVLKQSAEGKQLELEYGTIEKAVPPPTSIATLRQASFMSERPM